MLKKEAGPCAAPGCDRKAIAQGLCDTHYRRVRRGGASLNTPLRANITPEDRLWAKVNRTSPDRCWPWTGTTNDDGYGSLSVGDKMIKAHRYAWEVTNGPIPKGLDVCHECDNPPCCNPGHLFLGTRLENMEDKEAKGRGNHAVGARTRHAKITDAVAVLILKRLGEGEPGAAIARDLGISPSIVSRVRNGRTWAHVQAPLLLTGG